MRIELKEQQIGKLYEVSCIKVSEAFHNDANGIMEIGHVSVSGGYWVKSTAEHSNSSSCNMTRNLLIIGDSISAGYGVDGVFPCKFSASTENVNNGYVGLVASAINATAHSIVWSNKGVVRNYGDKRQLSEEPMPLFYNRTIATLSGTNNYWSPTQFTPDVVLVMLGTNDYSTRPHPTDQQFIAGLAALLAVIRNDYPTAKVAAMCAPLPAGRQCANIETAATQSNVAYLDIPTSTMSGVRGCDYHPSSSNQHSIAEVVIGAVLKMLV